MRILRVVARGVILGMLVVAFVTVCAAALAIIFIEPTDDENEPVRVVVTTTSTPNRHERLDLPAGVNYAELQAFTHTLALQQWAETAAAQAAYVTEHEREAMWDRLAQCETGGNWGMTGSTYSGGIGFLNAAWNEWGGLEFAALAGHATREEQIIIGERILAGVGPSAWGCAATAGLQR